MKSSEEKPNPSAPPEPEFFDEPKSMFRKGALSKLLLQKKTIAWAIVLLVSLALMMFLFSPKSKQEKSSSAPPKEETRAVVTARSLDQAIESSRQKEELEPKASPKALTLKKDRNLGTAIAVAVANKDKDEKHFGLYEKRERKEEKVLGLSSGTKIPTLLDNRVISFNTEAPVLAIVAQDFLWKGEVVIPKGSKFLGEASILKSLDRINVSFRMLIFPDGTEKRLRAMALSQDGSSGIRGKVEKHRDLRLIKALGETALGVGSLFVGSGLRSDPYSLEDQIRSNAAQNLFGEARQEFRGIKTESSITVEAFTPIFVMLLEPA